MSQQVFLGRNHILQNVFVWFHYLCDALTHCFCQDLEGIHRLKRKKNVKFLKHVFKLFKFKQVTEIIKKSEPANISE